MDKPVCFTASKKDLQTAISKVKYGINKKTPLPILGGYLFEVSGEQVTVRSTDLEVEIETSVENAQLSSDYLPGGRFAVDARTLEKILKTLPNEEIELHYCAEEEDSWSLGISTKDTALHISTLNAEDFPPSLALEKIDFQAVVTELALVAALTRVLPAVSTDDTRQVLTNVLLKYKDMHMHLVATDSYRLAQDQIETYEAEVFTNRKPVVLVPAYAVRKLLKIMGKEGEVLIKIDLGVTGRIEFIAQDARMVARLAEGEFPKYEQLLPEFYYLDVLVDRQALLSAVERASAILETPRANSYSENPYFVQLETGGTKLYYPLTITAKQEDNTVVEEVKAIVEVNSRLAKETAKEEANLLKLEKKYSATIEDDTDLLVGLEMSMSRSKSNILKMKAIQDKSVCIGFNPDFLLDGLKALEGDTISLQLMSAENPALLESTTNYSYLLMPVRLGG